MSSEKTVIAICGPTASGKTDFAIELALNLGTEIISADSRQCFRELNIGVAKPSAEQLKMVRHHFINSHYIFDEVNAGTFEQFALDTLATIFEKHDTVILAGGTGLYIKAFLEGLNKIPKPDKAIEKNIREQYELNGGEWLKEQIELNDPVFAQKGEMENPQRMMRALTVKLSSGQSILDFHSPVKTQRDFKVRKIFLELPRSDLYDRIDDRVDGMVDAGLVEEARTLYPHKNLNALQTVGYTELFDYFDGSISLEEAVRLIKRNTRHYAKRQLTWFKKYFVDGATEVGS